jgi:hypothetical protein
MSCHEIAALRLGLMNVLGHRDPAERAHEIAELGAAAKTPGPLASLAEAHDLDAVTKLYANAVGALLDKVAKTPASDRKLAYYRSLVVLTKKVELELRSHVDGLARLNRELEEMHDLVHEIFPAE